MDSWQLTTGDSRFMFYWIFCRLYPRISSSFGKLWYFDVKSLSVRSGCCSPVLLRVFSGWIEQHKQALIFIESFCEWVVRSMWSRTHGCWSYPTICCFHPVSLRYTCCGLFLASYKCVGFASKVSNRLGECILPNALPNALNGLRGSFLVEDRTEWGLCVLCAKNKLEQYRLPQEPLVRFWCGCLLTMCNCGLGRAKLSEFKG